MVRGCPGRRQQPPAPVRELKLGPALLSLSQCRSVPGAMDMLVAQNAILSPHSRQLSLSANVFASASVNSSIH